MCVPTETPSEGHTDMDSVYKVGLHHLTALAIYLSILTLGQNTQNIHNFMNLFNIVYVIMSLFSV